MKKDLKPGVKTTEFWATLLNAVLMVAVALRVVDQHTADTLAGLLIPLIGAAIPVVTYILGRTWLKAKQ